MTADTCARCGQAPFEDDGLVWSDELRDAACWPCREKLRTAAQEATERDPWTGVPRG